MGLASALAMAPEVPASAAPTLALSYVANSTGDSVNEYALGANGNVAPVAFIQGTSTGLSFPTGVAVDSSGDLFVANLGTNSITEYAPGAAGNVSPITTISGIATVLNSPESLTIDTFGDLWVANGGSTNGGSGILEFSPNATGNATPILAITGPSTGLNVPFGVAIDSFGDVFAANRNANSITEYNKGAHGDVAPNAAISGSLTGLSAPEGMAFDSSGNLIVANRGTGTILPSVTEYAKGATGNVAPIATIAGSNTGLRLPQGVGLDASGNVLVVDRMATSVFEFAKGATGNVSPVATISGSNTRLNGPQGLALFIPSMPSTDPTSTTASCSPVTVAVGQASTCAANVTDTSAGTPSVPSGTVSFTSSDPGAFGGGGSCTLGPAGASTASCSVTYTPSAVGSGSHTITATYAGDSTHAGSPGSASLTVTTPADTDLALTGVPATQTVNATGPSGAAVSFASPVALDEETPPAVTCDHASGSLFAIGTTTVHCSATDPDDTPSTVTASFNVTVNDTDLALTGLVADQTVNATGPSGAAVAFALPTAVDEETPPAVSCDHASGSLFPIGVTIVNCSASDNDDSPSLASASFNVTVTGAAGQLAALASQISGANIAPSDKTFLTLIVTFAANANNAGNKVRTCAALRFFTAVVGVLETLPPPYQIASSVGGLFIAEANQIRAVLGC